VPSSRAARLPEQRQYQGADGGARGNSRILLWCRAPLLHHDGDGHTDGRADGGTCGSDAGQGNFAPRRAAGEGPLLGGAALLLLPPSGHAHERRRWWRGARRGRGPDRIGDGCVPGGGRNRGRRDREGFVGGPAGADSLGALAAARRAPARTEVGAAAGAHLAVALAGDVARARLPALVDVAALGDRWITEAARAVLGVEPRLAHALPGRRAVRRASPAMAAQEYARASRVRA